jgi:poly-gamma-glutamate capsule biosynthesis protein CapA/YwtB (metallophosphatase superfamily)
MEQIRILIGGDTVPTDRDCNLFIHNDRRALFGDLLPEIESSDFFLLNLECPLTNATVPLTKTGPNLKASPDCVKGLVMVQAVNLANNHILDYGSDGVMSTIKVCLEQGIATFGAGESRVQAREPLIREIKGRRVGFLGVAENEFASATESTAGAYGLELIDLVGNIRELRSKVDLCVVLYHGGNEHYPYPSPALQSLCRFLVEEGAGAVICQHSHCVGCYERHRNGLIVYGQGNFIFASRGARDPSWSEGVLVELLFEDDARLGFRLVPYAQSCEEPGTRMMSLEQEKKFLRQIEQRSQEVLDPKVLQFRWEEYCSNVRGQYLRSVYLPPHRFYSRLNRLFRATDRLVPRSQKRLLLNLVRCESHHEALKSILSAE